VGLHNIDQSEQMFLSLQGGCFISSGSKKVEELLAKTCGKMPVYLF
jgi:hypothetical protein